MKLEGYCYGITVTPDVWLILLNRRDIRTHPVTVQHLPDIQCLSYPQDLDASDKLIMEGGLSVRIWRSLNIKSSPEHRKSNQCGITLN